MVSSVKSKQSGSSLHLENKENAICEFLDIHVCITHAYRASHLGFPSMC